MVDEDGQAGHPGYPWPVPRRVLIATPVTEPTRAALAGRPAVAYLPSLASEPEALATALEELHPDTLVVGGPVVRPATLRRWAWAGGHGGRLVLVPRGTGGLAPDVTAAAAAAGIEIREAPVNPHYPARYLVDALLDDDSGDDDLPDDPLPRDRPGRAGRPLTVGLLGAGAANVIVARELTAAGHHVVAYTPRLAAQDPAARAAWLADAGLAAAEEAGRLRIARDVDGVFAGTELVAIAVPLTDRAPHPTRGLVGRQHIKAFAGSRIVSVSEPDVFSATALREVYARRDITVVIDNAAPVLAAVRRDVAEFFGDADELRPGFALRSEAMHAPAAGADLDQAMLLAAAVVELDETVADPWPVPSLVDGEGPVVVVGGGIVGLTIALALADAGWSNLAVLDAAPDDRTDPAAQGTTYAGIDSRQLSLTATLPHADAPRRDLLRRGPLDGGWLGRDDATLDGAERWWVSALERLADRPRQHALVTEASIALNRLGLRGWDSLFARRPELLAGVRSDPQLPHLYLSEAELARGRALQARINDRCADLSPADLRARWPALAGPEAGGVAGAVEVAGYAVNIHRLADNIRDALAGVGVKVTFDARVTGFETTADPSAPLAVHLADGSVVPAGTAIVTVGGRDLARLARPPLGPGNPAGGGATFTTGVGAVQQVVGCGLTLPNPGLTSAIKVLAPDPVGVVNVTLSPDGERIHASGGFCWIGLAEPTAYGAPVAAVMAELETMVARLFPALVSANGTLAVLERRTCERPMTPDGLPVLERADGLGGRVIVAGGTNAGGTVQATALAALVSSLLAGEEGCAHLSLRANRATLWPGPAAEIGQRTDPTISQ